MNRDDALLWFSHLLVSAAVVAGRWETLQRKLTDEIGWFLVAYFGVSMLLLAIVRFRGLFARAAIALAVPYVASLVSYLAIAVPWAIGNRVGDLTDNVMGVVVLSLFWPYLLMWAGIVSVTNLGAVLAGTQFRAAGR